MSHQSAIAVYGKGVVSVGRHHTAVLSPVGEGVVGSRCGNHSAGLTLLISATARDITAVGGVSRHGNNEVLHDIGEVCD